MDAMQFTLHTSDAEGKCGEASNSRAKYILQFPFENSNLFITFFVHKILSLSTVPINARFS